MKKPCGNCPWRKDAATAHWHDQHFVDIWANCQDDGLALMLCHKSKPAEGVKIICAGYAIVVGFDSIGLRLAALRGEFNPNEYAAGGVELFETFEEVLEAQGIDIPARNCVIQLD